MAPRSHDTPQHSHRSKYPLLLLISWENTAFICLVIVSVNSYDLDTHILGPLPSVWVHALTILSPRHVAKLSSNCFSQGRPRSLSQFFQGHVSPAMSLGLLSGQISVDLHIKGKLLLQYIGIVFGKLISGQFRNPICPQGIWRCLQRLFGREFSNTLQCIVFASKCSFLCPLRWNWECGSRAWLSEYEAPISTKKSYFRASRTSDCSHKRSSCFVSKQYPGLFV